MAMPHHIKIGDRFRRPGVFLEVYRVVALRAYDRDLILAELIDEADGKDTLTVPASTLLNDKHWRPVGG